jgi:hypothetical protein
LLEARIEEQMRTPYVNATTVAVRVSGQPAEHVITRFLDISKRPAETHVVKKGVFRKPVEEPVGNPTRLSFASGESGWEARIQGGGQDGEPSESQVFLWLWELDDGDVILQASSSFNDIFEFPIHAPREFSEYTKLFDLVESTIGGRKIERTELDAAVPGAKLVSPVGPSGELTRHATDPLAFRRTSATADDVVAAINNLGGHAVPALIAEVLAEKGLSVMSEGITAAESEGRTRWINDEWWAL